MRQPHVDDLVRLTRDVPELQLKQGDVGIVCSTWFSPNERYEVEFAPGLDCRTRALLLGRDAAARAAADVAALIAPELGWSAAETAAQVDDFRRRVAAERDAAGLPETALDASIGA